MVEVAAAMQKLKSGKAADEDEILLGMLKALNGEGALWLTRVCQVAWKFGKTPKNWQTSEIISTDNKGDRKKCTRYRRISLLSLPQNVHILSVLKEMLRNSESKVGRWPV